MSTSAENMPRIKIFVSRRIDLNSKTIDCPIYFPVRCGAVFDQENPMGLPGDNTGDNISKRRLSFCEFTVQYWAWKNTQFDYYGLCHYRRYLSFSEQKYKTDAFGMVRDPALCGHTIQKYRLADTRYISDLVPAYDAVVAEPAPVERRRILGGRPKNVRELWAAHDGIFFEKRYREMLIPLIDEFAPEYADSAKDYFLSAGHRGYNCYILKRELFDRLCRFQFPIMFEIEKRIDPADYTDMMKRTPAFLGEMLYGVFIHHIINEEHRRVKEVQLVYFDETEKDMSPAGYLMNRVRIQSGQILRALADPLFPLGTRRREWIKEKLRG